MVDKAAGPAAVDKTQMAILPELFHGQTGTFRDPVPEIPEGAVYIKKDRFLSHMSMLLYAFMTGYPPGRFCIATI
jgi:hypothetical protein